MSELPLNQVLCGDCREVMKTFPDDCIDLVVTSPPYWGLRDYGVETVRVWDGLPECEHEWGINQPPIHKGQVTQTKYGDRPSSSEGGSASTGNFCVHCGAWRGSLGLEPHPQMFIDHLTDICTEVKRILKQTGSFWLNLGDTYCGSWGNYGKRKGKQRPQNVEKFDRKGQTPQTFRVPQSYTEKSGWLQPKQLLGMPWRVAISLQEQGWILRNCVIWHKPNHMPSSVKDRLTPSYEFFFFFVKARKYYFDLDSIRQPYSAVTIARITQPNVMNQKGGQKQRELRGEGGGNASRSADMVKSLARKIIVNEDRKELHGPTYRRHQLAIEGGQSLGVNLKGKNPGDLWTIPTHPFPAAHFATFPMKLIEPIIKSSCHKDGVVLDPFCGSGTSLRVARKLGRSFIGIDVKEEYCKMARRRVKKDRYRSIPDDVVPLSEFQGNETLDVGVPPNRRIEE